MVNKLNFGCGNKILEGYVNVDLAKNKNVDYSFDFDKFPYPFEDNTFDEIKSHCVFEHLNNLRKVVNELWRISKPNAIFDITVPYYNHVCAFNEPDHQHWFNERTFYNLFGCSNRKINSEGENMIGKFEIVNQVFKTKKGLRFIPKKLLLKLSHFIPNLIIRIDIKVRVIKLSKEIKP